MEKSQYDRLKKLIQWFLAFYAFTFSISVPLANMMVDAALILMAYQLLFQKHQVSFDGMDYKLLICIFSFALLTAVSGFFAIDPSKSWKTLSFHLYYPLTLLLGLLYWQSIQQRHKAVLALSGSIAVSSLFTLFEAASGMERPPGPTGILLLAATYIQLSLPFLWGYALDNPLCSKRHRLFLCVTSVLALSALLASQTRAGWVAVAFMLLLYVLLRFRSFSLRHATVLITICIVVFAVFLFQPSMRTRLYSITDQNFVSNTERIFIWKSTWNMFRDHPWLGIGPGNFEYQYRNHYVSEKAIDKFHPHAHNIFLHYLAEMGIVGFFSYLSMFVYVLNNYARRFRRNAEDWPALSMLLASSGFVIMGMMDWTYGMFPSAAQYYWFLVGLTWNWHES